MSRIAALKNAKQRHVKVEPRLLYIPTDIAVARFVSDFDDGSSFGSICLVDTGTRRILALSSAGCPCDDAACQEQYVILPNGETRRVNDPDQDIVYPYGYDLCWNE